MKILMVSSEAAPFAKTGGLADAVSALSLSLAEAGHEVKILIPRYYSINRDSLSLLRKSVLVNTGWSEIPVDFYSTGENPQVCFVDYEKLFGREGIYGSDFTPDYPDNPLRFSVLARSAFALCRAIGWIPDIMHSHDWSGSLVPVLLRHFEKKDFPCTKSVLTIHNMGYQGRYPYAAFRLLGLPDEYFSKAHFDYYGNLNFLQAGIIAADKVNTVSETYAKEITTAEYGEGLDGLLYARQNDTVGIVNGIGDEWSPKTDPFIFQNFTEKTLAKRKSRNKLMLISAFWSECRDSNSRPLEPHSSAIPNFATPGYACVFLNARVF